LPWNTIGTVNPDTTNGNKTFQDFDGVSAYKYFQLSLNTPKIVLALSVNRGDQVIYATDGNTGNVAAFFSNAKAFNLNGESVTFTVASATYDALNRFTKVVIGNSAISQVGFNAGAAVIINPTLAIDLNNLYICNNPYEITIARLNRDDYVNLPNKTFQGRPLQYWYDRQRDVPIMTLWPSPDKAATQNQITIWRKRYVMDVGGINDQLDIPQRWFDAVVYSLAVRLAEERTEVDPQLIPMLSAKADLMLMSARQEERDNSPTYWSPNLRGYTR
jgi:hypothetical protein